MNGHEGSWLEQWVDEFLASTPPGWPFEEALGLDGLDQTEPGRLAS